MYHAQIPIPQESNKKKKLIIISIIIILLLAVSGFLLLLKKDTKTEGDQNTNTNGKEIEYQERKEEPEERDISNYLGRLSSLSNDYSDYPITVRNNLYKNITVKGANSRVTNMALSWNCGEYLDLFAINLEGDLFVAEGVGESLCPTNDCHDDASKLIEQEVTVKEIKSDYKFKEFYIDYDRSPLSTCFASETYVITVDDEIRKIEYDEEGNIYKIGKLYTSYVPHKYQFDVCSTQSREPHCESIYISEDRKIYIQDVRKPLQGNGKDILVKNIIDQPPGHSQQTKDLHKVYIISSENLVYEMQLYDGKEGIRYNSTSRRSGKIITGIRYDNEDVTVEYNNKTKDTFVISTMHDYRGYIFEKK